MVRSNTSDRYGVSAFTLIELLVVVSIIALLAAMLLPSLSRARTNARLMVCVNNFKQTGLALTMYDTDYENIPVGWTPGSTQSAVGGLWQGLTECNQTNGQDFQWCSTSVYGLLHPYSGTMKIAVCPIRDPDSTWPLNSETGTMCTGRSDNAACYEPGSCPDGTCQGRYYAYSLRGNAGGGTTNTFDSLRNTMLEQYPERVKAVTFANGVNMFSGEGILGLSGAAQSATGGSLVWGSTILSDAQFSAHRSGRRNGVTNLSYDGAAKLQHITGGYEDVYAIGLDGMSLTDVLYRRFEN